MNRRPFRPPTAATAPSIDPAELTRLRAEAHLVHQLTTIVGSVVLRDRSGQPFFDGPCTRDALCAALHDAYAREAAATRHLSR